MQIEQIERIVPGTPEFDWEYQVHAARYALVAPEARGLDVLDAACGVGYGSALVAATAASVTALDISLEALSVGTRTYAHPGVRYAAGRVESLPFPAERFDVIASFETIEHIAEPAAALAEFARVLRPGGRVFLSVPNGVRDRHNGNPHHLSFFTLPELRALVSERFHVASVRGQFDQPLHPRMVEWEFPVWFKQLVPTGVRTRLNDWRHSRVRFVPEAKAEPAACWIVEAVKR
jgi:2-polyprenyl-3-methyl-5-hydroxy-6-metoxy-1,4-benzoquinol methylase